MLGLDSMATELDESFDLLSGGKNREYNLTCEMHPRYIHSF